MERILNLLAWLVAHPWVMPADRVEALVRLLASERAAHAVQGSRGQEPAEAPLYTMRGSVAVVPVVGILGRPEWAQTRYERIASGIAAAMGDPAVGSVVLRVMSPGGSAMGAQGAADAIYSAARGGAKPVVSHIDDMAFSGGIYMASQASRVWANPASQVGSIGTVAAIIDWSALFEKEGLKVHVVRRGEMKALGITGAPVTEAQLAELDRMVGDVNEHFLASVARGRGIAMERAAQLGDGRIHTAEKAPAGLIDGVRPFEQTIAELNRNHPAGRAATPNLSPAVAGGDNTPACGQGATMNREQVAAAIAAGKITVEQGQQLLAGTLKVEQVAGLAVFIASIATTIAALGGGQQQQGQQGQQQGGEVLATVGPEGVRRAREEGQAEGRSAETARVQAILDISVMAEGRVPEIAAMRSAALGDPNVTAEKFRADVMAAIETANPPAGSLRIAVGAEGRERRNDAMVVSMITRGCPALVSAMQAGGERGTRIAEAMGFEGPAQFARASGEARAGGLHGIGLRDLCREAAQRQFPGRVFDNPLELVQAAMTTSDLPAITGAFARRVLLGAIPLAPVTWPEWCGVRPVQDFRDVDLVSMSRLTDFQEVKEEGDPEHITFGDRKETGATTLYASNLAISFQTFVNDDLGALADLPMKIAGEWADHLEATACAVLTANAAMQDGVALFHADHANLAGSGAVPSADTLSAAEVAMLSQVDFHTAKPVSVMPTIWLGPVAYAPKARKVFEAEFDPDFVSNNPGVSPNVMRGKLRPLGTRRLTGTAWYVLGDPRLTPAVQLLLLNGQTNPTISRVEADNPLRLKWTITGTAAGKATAHEAIYKNPGA